MFSYFNVFSEQAKVDLASEGKVLAQAAAFHPSGDVAFLSNLEGTFAGVRITLIADNGDVLYDSQKGILDFINHKDRPEVQEAMQNGTGQQARYSETLQTKTFYYAEKLPNGHILRLARETDGIAAIFFAISPLLLGLLICILLAAVFVSSYLTKRILQPMYELADHMEQADSYDYDEEFFPFIAKIREQNQLIQKQMGKLRTERDTIHTITEHMKEGLILLDKDKNVLSINHGAIDLLHAPQEEYEGRNILLVSRNPQFVQTIEAAMQNDGQNVVLQENGTYCQIFANPVYSQEEKIGVIVLLIDITKEQAAAKARRDFSANVSHELKTPLTSISGFAEMMQNGMVDDKKEMRHFAHKIYDESQRLLEMINDIIHLSQIDTATNIPKEKIDLYEIAKGVTEHLQFQAQQKEVLLQLHGQSCPLAANRRMMEELLYNLVDNAIRYNRNGGQVEVEIGQQKEFAIVKVADTGRGIPNKDQQRVFERFYRVDQSRAKETGGSGLGLSIVKHVAECHNAEIVLQSTENVGTTITVKIPLIDEMI